MVFTIAQEEYFKKEIILILAIIEVPHLEEEYSNENTTKSWVAHDEEKTSKS